MSRIVIKRRVSFSFLGDEYKDAYVVLKAIPVSYYEELQKRTAKAKNNVENTKVMTEVVQENFLSGQFPIEGKLEDMTKEDIGGLDELALVECYMYITGQKLDPKPEGQ